jgi:hypothetical protein
MSFVVKNRIKFKYLILTIYFQSLSSASISLALLGPMIIANRPFPSVPRFPLSPLKEFLYTIILQIPVTLRLRLQINSASSTSSIGDVNKDSCDLLTADFP